MSMTKRFFVTVLFAVIYGALPIAAAQLLDAQDNSERKSGENGTPYFQAKGEQEKIDLLFEAAATGNVERAQVLIASGVSANVCNMGGYEWAPREKRIDVACKLADSLYASFDPIAVFGQLEELDKTLAPIDVATIMEKENMVPLLLQLGSKESIAPLLASIAGNKSLMKLFADRDRTEPDSQEKKELRYAALLSHVLQNNEDTLDYYLHLSGRRASLYPIGDNDTLLFHAAGRSANPRIVQLLLDEEIERVKKRQKAMLARQEAKVPKRVKLRSLTDRNEKDETIVDALRGMLRDKQSESDEELGRLKKCLVLFEEHPHRVMQETGLAF